MWAQDKCGRSGPSVHGWTGSYENFRFQPPLVCVQARALITIPFVTHDANIGLRRWALSAGSGPWRTAALPPGGAVVSGELT